MIRYPNGVMVVNIMADGSECDDLSTHLKSPDQLPELTRMLIAKFIRDGIKANAKKNETARTKNPA